jgi:hypothetical protein
VGKTSHCQLPGCTPHEMMALWNQFACSIKAFQKQVLWIPKTLALTCRYLHMTVAYPGAPDLSEIMSSRDR